MKKSIRIIALLLLLSICALTSCEQTADIEEIQETVLIGDRSASLYDIPYDMTVVGEGRYANAFGFDYSDFASVKAENDVFEFRGVQYSLDYRVRVDFNQYLDELIASFTGTDPEGNRVSIDYTAESKVPVEWLLHSSKTFNGQLTDNSNTIGKEEALKIALDYIDNTLIGEYGNEIDISKYQLFEEIRYGLNEESDKISSYDFTWCEIINGVTFHEVSISVDYEGEIYYVYCAPRFDDDIIDNIPLLTTEQYYEIAENIIKSFYDATGETVDMEVALYGAEKKPPEQLLRVVRLFSPEIYAVKFEIVWNVTAPDGRNDTQSCPFYIPIETVE